MAVNVSEMSRFYTDVFVTNSRNMLSTRCRFLVSWTMADSTYDPGTPASRYAGRSYSEVREVLLLLMTRFRRYVSSISVPDLDIGGKALDDGMGSCFVQSNSMLHPDRNELQIDFLETQVSVSDMLHVWMDVNSRPFLRPIRLNLNLDYVSDRDGKTPVMSYQASGCRPVKAQMIDCSHDGRTVKARRVTFGFDLLRPVSTDGTHASDSESAVMRNWNLMVEGYERSKEEEGS